MILIATQCFPPKLGGIEGYMGGLADALAAAGEPVEVFADGPPEAEDAERPYPVRRFAGWRPLRARRKAAALAAAIRTAAARGAPVSRVLCDSWKSAETAARALPAGGARPRLIALAHGMELPAAPRPAKRRRLARALAAADAILANSQFTADRTRPYLADPARLRVATPPIPPQAEADPALRQALRARLTAAGFGHAAGADGAGPLIAGLGRLEPRKGFDQVLVAAAGLAAAHPGLALAIAGAGPDRDRLEALARERGAPAFFLGRVTEAEKAALLAEADLFAMPSRAEGDSVEGFGVVYLEAGWRGTPSLAGRVGGASDAVLEGRTGWLCDGADARSVRAALDAALSDPAERRRRAEAARAHAATQLWSARVAEYLAA